MSRTDRRWLLATGLPILPLFVLFYVTIACRDRVLGEAPDPAYFVCSAFASALWAALRSLFVIGIPLRFVQNILIKERRSNYKSETIAIIVAFASICFWLYSTWVFPPEG
jgi:hypothetical protein